MSSKPNLEDITSTGAGAVPSGTCKKTSQANQPLITDRCNHNTDDSEAARQLSSGAKSNPTYDNLSQDHTSIPDLDIELPADFTRTDGPFAFAPQSTSNMSIGANDFFKSEPVPNDEGDRTCQPKEDLLPIGIGKKRPLSEGQTSSPPSKYAKMTIRNIPLKATRHGIFGSTTGPSFRVPGNCAIQTTDKQSHGNHGMKRSENKTLPPPSTFAETSTLNTPRPRVPYVSPGAQIPGCKWNITIPFDTLECPQVGGRSPAQRYRRTKEPDPIISMDNSRFDDQLRTDQSDETEGMSVLVGRQRSKSISEGELGDSDEEASSDRLPRRESRKRRIRRSSISKGGVIKKFKIAENIKREGAIDPTIIEEPIDTPVKLEETPSILETIPATHCDVSGSSRIEDSPSTGDDLASW